MKTKDKIIVAAKAEFQQKGLAGARMQEIADRCGINKALLHYHFNSKDELFRAVLIAGIADVFPVLMGTLNAAMPLREKLQTVIRLYIDQLSQNPELPRFVLKCSLSKYGFRASRVRTRASADRAKTGL